MLLQVHLAVMCVQQLCTRSRVVDKVDIFRPTTLAPKRRRRAVRCVTPTMEKRLRDRLQVERDAIVDSEIGYQMLGKYVFIPDTCIDELGKRAKFIKDCDDVSSVPGLRKQFVNRLYSVVTLCGILCCVGNLYMATI